MQQSLTTSQSTQKL